MQDKNEKFLVQVDQNKKWSPGEYREVTREELDELIECFGNRVLRMCSNGKEGAVAMWACFKSAINHGCYSDMINAYRLLSDDPKSLVDREHELRHAWNEYQELWRIRYYGTVEAYYLEQAQKAKEYRERHMKEAK